MQKITHINFAKGFRGGERQTLLLIEALSKKGYTQTLLTRKDATLAEKASQIKNLTIITLAKPYFFSLAKIKKSDILHAHETKAAHFAYFAYLRYKVPYIITRRVDNPIKRSFLNNRIYLHSKQTVALSSVIKEHLLKIDKHIKVATIPSASSALGTDNTISKKIELRFKDNFLIANIGELDNKHKGQFYLIEAAKKLQVSHPDIHFLFLGQGIDEENYKNQAKNLSNITFEGYVNNLGDYIPHFDLFVFPSLHEGLGSILLDIMAFAVPIIATDVGGIPDIINDKKNGLLAPTRDADALEKAILTLYHDKQLADILSQKAQEDAKLYTVDKMCEHYIKLYKKVLHES